MNEVALEKVFSGVSVIFPILPSLVYTHLSLLPEGYGIYDQTVRFDILTLNLGLHVCSDIWLVMEEES